MLFKTLYVGVNTLIFAAYDAIMCFNDAVMKKLNVVGYLIMDLCENTAQTFSLSLSYVPALN
jgi:hypothetical protein